MQMIRAAACGLMAIAAAQTVAACELGISVRSGEAASYIENAQRCLTVLPTGFTFDDAMETDNLRRVNAERVREGKTKLIFRPELQAAARWHSMDMAANNFFSHKSKDQRTHDKRVSLLDRSLIYDASRENIAMIRGEFTLGTEHETLHTGLMESPGHKNNILADNISHAAMGVVRYKNGVWLTQVFVNEAGELSAPAPVRMYPGQLLPLRAELKDWTFEGFHAEQGDKYIPFKSATFGSDVKVPGGVYGDIILSTRGERRISGGGGSYINLSGPEVTMVTSRERAKSSASKASVVTPAATSSTAYGQPYTPPSAPTDYPKAPKENIAPASDAASAKTPERPVKRRVTRRTISRKVIS